MSQINWFVILYGLSIALAILGVIGFLAWLTAPEAPTPHGYQGHNPKIPRGAYRLKVGTGIRNGDKVWGFDGWYGADAILYSVKEGDIFIRQITPGAPIGNEVSFWSDPRRQIGHEDKAGTEAGYPSLQ